VLDVTTLSLLRVISFEDEYSQGGDIVTPRYLKELIIERTKLEIEKSEILHVKHRL